MNFKYTICIYKTAILYPFKIVNSSGKVAMSAIIGLSFSVIFNAVFVFLLFIFIGVALWKKWNKGNFFQMILLHCMSVYLCMCVCSR